ncbi:hypothetical protein NE261_00535 [Enterococcus italicus]|uniref:hypothetical protein n=1 Tax=Enterococcus italicus TaxID=246144 RepID=UPI0020735554|nr:hypothetical protein [Enterococcus italicus]MCM6930305.1 hypothetical protein [Enterococcus italicus]
MENYFDPLEYAKECIKEEVKSQMKERIQQGTIDIKMLAEITCHSTSFLEKNFIVTEEAKELEKSPSTKRLWLYPEIRDCWREFCIRENVKERSMRS